MTWAWCNHSPPDWRSNWRLGRWPAPCRHGSRLECSRACPIPRNPSKRSLWKKTHVIKRHMSLRNHNHGRRKLDLNQQIFAAEYSPNQSHRFLENCCSPGGQSRPKYQCQRNLEKAIQSHQRIQSQINLESKHQPTSWSHTANVQNQLKAPNRAKINLVSTKQSRSSILVRSRSENL